jgi:hypothetical protein
MGTVNKQMTIPLNKGIARNTINGNQGEMEDMVNLHYRDGALRPVRKTALHLNDTNYDLIVLHDTVAFSNAIGRKHYASYDEVISFNFLTGAVLQTVLQCENGEFVVRLTPFKNYLIVSTSQGRLLRYLYDIEKALYVSLNIDVIPEVTMVPYDVDGVASASLTATDDTAHNYSYSEEGYDCSEELKGLIYAKINELAQDSKLCGAISYRLAYRLADGTFILPTQPRIIVDNMKQSDDNNYSSVEAWSIYATDGQLVRALIPFIKWKATLDTSHYSSLADENKIIQSLCVFFSKPLIKYGIEETLTNAWLNIPVGNIKYMHESGVISPDWNTLEDQQHYLVAEIPFSRIIDGTGTLDLEEFFKLTNFYQNYATKEALTVDSFSHHVPYFDYSFLYNSRLWLTGFKRTLCDPFEIDPMLYKFTIGYAPLSYNCKVQVKLLIDGLIKVIQSDTFRLHSITNGTLGRFHFPAIYYPDSRAFEITIFITHSSIWKELLTVSLTKSAIDNYSFYFDHTSDMGEQDDYCNVVSYSETPQHRQVFFGIEKTLANLAIGAIEAEDNVDDSYISQIQCTQVNNPFVFPSQYNYVVGTGRVMYLSVQTDVISEGQFGQFPVLALTDEGIYSLEQGTGDILISNVVPLSSEVATGEPCSTSKGIFIPTQDTVMVVQGRNVENIARSLRGRINTAITGNSHFAMYSNHAQVVQLNTICTSLQEFREDLSNAVTAMGYDPVNKRVILSSTTWSFSYVYDLETGVWYRISESYDYFIQTFPILYAVNSRGILNISDIESDTSVVQVHFHTKPINFGIANRKKFEQSVLRCLISTQEAKYATFAVLVSNDGFVWYRATANDRRSGDINDILLTYTQASFRYFVFAFWAELIPATNNFIENIEAEVKPRYTHRLRSI